MQDVDIFDWMVDQLDATGKFQWVGWGRVDAPLPTEGATAHILRVSNEADPRSMNMETVSRRVKYNIILSYWSTDIDKRKRRMLNIEGMIVNMFNSKRLAAMTIPNRTLCERAADDNTNKVATGQSRAVIDGSFSYDVPHVDGFDVDFDGQTPATPPEMGYGAIGYGMGGYGK